MAGRAWTYIRRNHLALVALFFALSGGVAWALAANSVGTKQIKPNAVRSGDVKNEALTGRDIRESTLADTGSCPGEGFVRFRDLCYQDADQPASGWLNAVISCGESGLRLPTIAEAYLFAKDLSAPASSVDYWSSTTEGFGDTDNVIGVTKNTDGQVNFHGGAPNQELTYRCVTTPAF